MFGIDREWVNELVAAYRVQNPTDTREDWLLKEAILQMRNPLVWQKFKQKWMFRQIYEDQETADIILKRKHGMENR